MKKFMSDFFLRGLMAASGGPLVLAIIYAILGATGTLDALSPIEVSLGIFSITILALFVGGMTAIYQVERLPLASAILIHGAGLYAAYLLIYLINGWLQRQLTPIVIFSVAFIAGYALIWFFIYRFTKRKAASLNKQINR